MSAFIRHGEETADNLLRNNRSRLDALAAALQEEETMVGTRVEEIIRLTPLN